MITAADIPYGGAPDQVVDIHTPDAPGPHRLVFYVHGGGWTMGSHRSGRPLARHLTNAGFAVACIGYRKFPAVGVATIAADVATAIATVLGRAAEHAGFEQQFAMIGHSAGGHLIALLATDTSYLREAGVEPSRISAVIPLDGVFDIAQAAAMRPKPLPPFGLNPALWRQLSPATHTATRPQAARFFLLHEDSSPYFAAQTRQFAVRLRATGHDPVLGVAGGLRHGEMAQFRPPAAPPVLFILRALQQAMPASARPVA